MRRAEVVALGLVQGPAELLPVSSSGHVAALPLLLGWEHARLEGARRKEVEVALHAGGAGALLAGLRRGGVGGGVGGGGPPRPPPRPPGLPAGGRVGGRPGG